MGNDATNAILRKIKRIAEEEKVGGGADSAAWVRVADLADLALELTATVKTGALVR